MLAKNSLLFQVFKAKYFPTRLIFATSATKGSYAWQSILKARNVISMGMQWRLGDGKRIDIYNDNWLPRKGFAKIVSPHVPILQGALVAALINSNTRIWDRNLLHQHFLSFEANSIKAIPLCWTNQNNCLMWPTCKNGEYSVKTGCQILCKVENISAASSSDTSNQEQFWKRIWKLCIPNKIKIFLWRVCSNALPSKENLKKKKILDDAKCSACLSVQENTFHAIWGCEMLHHIWTPYFSWIRIEHPEVVCGALRVAEWGHPSLSQIVKDTSFIVGLPRTFSFSRTRDEVCSILHSLACYFGFSSILIKLLGVDSQEKKKKTVKNN